MDAFTKLKNISLVDHVSKYLWNPTTETAWYRFRSSNDTSAPTLLVYKDESRWYFDFANDTWWTIIDFQMNYFKVDLKEATKQLCWIYWITDDNKKTFKKSVKRHMLVEDFETYRLQNILPWFKRFLQTRWLTHENMEQYKDNLLKISKELWFCENQFVDTDTFKDVIIFPCLDENKKIIWAKLRRCDWDKIKTSWWMIKSVSISKPKDYTWSQTFSTWLIYNDISEKYVLIVEWETDYIILKMLWFTSVIWNLGWVSSNSEKIQQLAKTVDKIVCMYDNDEAWYKWWLKLQEKIGRPIRFIEYKKIDWVDKYDINDLFKMWYRYEDFVELIKSSKLLDQEKTEEIAKIEEKQELYKNRYFYNDTKMEYFDIKDFSFKTWFSLSRHLFIKQKELEDLRLAKIIPTYDWVCYYDWWKKWSYNLLDKSQFINKSNNPVIHPDIEELLVNLCNDNQENYEWLLKAILYKYTHLNDVLIPAVIFHGVWWTWKGIFMNLLAQIFGENNTKFWLTQESIEWRFSAYSGQKLIVEFKELSVDNTAKGKRNMNKLKTFIMEKNILIEKKGQDAVSTENIAWFIMSSNESKPVHLDSKDSWNRRFTIIKTWKSLGLEKGWKISETIKNKECIENFISYLFEHFKDIPTSKNIEPLDNEDKRDLEFLSESVWNLFFKWFELRYPNINKITNQQKDYMLDLYRMEIWEWEFDDRYKSQFFNSGLSVRYKPCTVRIWELTKRWYKIDKEVSWSWCFAEWEF